MNRGTFWGRLALSVASLFWAACAGPTTMPTSAPTLTPTAMPSSTAPAPATAMPTSTATVEVATPTSPPSITPTVLATPVIFAGLKFRAPAEAAQAWNTSMRFLESAAFETYAGETLSQAGQTYAYTVPLAWDEELIWANGWCAATREQLEVEWATISMRFSVNDEPLAENRLAVYEAQGAQMFCRWRYAVVSGWPAGPTQLATAVTLAQPITDETRTYPAGTHVYTYAVEGP